MSTARSMKVRLPKQDPLLRPVRLHRTFILLKRPFYPVTDALLMSSRTGLRCSVLGITVSVRSVKVR